MNILLTGALGQLGREFKAIAGRQDNSHNIYYTDAAAEGQGTDRLDITDEDSILKYIEGKNIGMILNFGAYTDVEKAESEEDKAYRINADAAGSLARICLKHNIFLVHISTDYIFDGSECYPISESETAAPLSVYGMSKYKGEELIQESGCRYMIIRTSWLYSRFGNNFVHKIAKRASKNGSVSVVCDQVGSPTNAEDLASFIWHNVVNCDSLERCEGIFHYSDEGVCSWYDFAKAIVYLKGIRSEVRPCYTRDISYRAARPAYSVLNKKKVKTVFGIDIPHWFDSLNRMIKDNR